jgi:hypothetical protein
VVVKKRLLVVQPSRDSGDRRRRRPKGERSDLATKATRKRPDMLNFRQNPVLKFSAAVASPLSMLKRITFRSTNSVSKRHRFHTNRELV